MNLVNKSLLDKLEKRIILNNYGEITFEKLSEYFSCFNKIGAENLQQNKNKIAYLVTDLLRKYDAGNTKVDLEELAKMVEEIIQFVGVMYDSITNENDSSEALIYFLFSLKNRVMDRFEANLYRELSETINDVSWLFKLKIGEEYIFPVHELIVEVAENFEYTNDNLLHLTMALQIFKDIDEKFKTSDSEQKIRNIASKYNIGILECLIDSGTLFECSDINYKLNSTLVAKNEEYILIRNKSKEYFSDFDGVIHEEKNEDNDKMCYFVKIEIDEKWKLIDFKSFILGSSNVEKRKFLSYIIKTKKFNFLYEKLIIVNKDSNEFIGLVNESKNDSHICLKEKNFENTFDGFYEAIVSNYIADVRTSIIYGDSDKCDIVTLDYVLAISKYLVTHDYNYDWLSCEYADKEIAYQSAIVKGLFEFVMKNHNTLEFCKLYERYYSFLNENMKITANTTIDQIENIVLPFLPYKPFENIDVLIGWINKKDEYSKGMHIVKIKVKSGKLDKEIYDDNDKNITSFKESNVVLEMCDVVDGYVIVDYDDESIHIDENLDKIFNVHSKILEFCDYIVYDDINKINLHLSRIIKVIKGTNIRVENKSKFNIMGIDGENVICLYKLLWHFRTYSIYESKILLFYDLILENHHTESILQDDWKSFFESISTLKNNKGTLMIAKESCADSGTLFTKYCDYMFRHKCGSRGDLNEIFDANAIQEQITVDSKEGYKYRGEKIERIIFITDNIAHGTATKQLLKYHCTGVKDNSIKKFLKFEDGKSVQKIINKNKISDNNIEVYSLYCLKDKISIRLENGSEFIINRMKDIDGKYILNSEISKLYEAIYNEETRANTGILCIIRCNNMPNKSLFNEKTTNTNYVVGLFHRKDENIFNTYEVI